jgi:hypothetical protein
MFEKAWKRFLADTCAVVDLSVVVMIGIVFAALMVIAYIIFTLQTQLGATGDAANTIGNITSGFDSAINLILVAITIFILALAIAALLMLRGSNR